MTLCTSIRGSILKIRSTDDMRKNQGNGLDDLVIPESDPRVRLVGRYETDVKKLYLIPKVLKAWVWSTADKLQFFDTGTQG